MKIFFKIYQNKVNSSLSFIKRSGKYAHNCKWSTSFPGYSLFLAGESILVAVGHESLDFADSTKRIDGTGTMIKFLSPLNLSTEPSRKWKLNITWSKNVCLSKTNSKKDM